MANYGTITFGGVTLNVTNMMPSNRQKTRKVILGKSLVQMEIIGLADQQWELEIDGVIVGANAAALGTNRAALEALEDVSTHAFVDGIHDGTYYLVPGSLYFEDSGDRAGSSYVFRMTLVEE